MLDRCLTCPGVAQLVEYADQTTDWDVSETATYLRESKADWDLSNLREQLGTPVTFFVPFESGWSTVSDAIRDRLQTRQYTGQRLDLIKHTLVPGEYWAKDLVQLAKEQGGSFKMPTLNGEPVLVEYKPETDDLFFEGGKLFVINIDGLDGVIHLTNHTPNPRSLRESVFDAAVNGATKTNISMHVSTIKKSAQDLVQSLSYFAPETTFYVANDKFQRKQLPSSEFAINSFLKSHVIDNKFYNCAELVRRKGQLITTLSGAKWILSVHEETGMPCIDHTDTITEGVTPSRSCVVECDVLGHNGVAHVLDDTLNLEGQLVEYAAPTSAPTTTMSPTEFGPTQTPSKSLSTENTPLVLCQKQWSLADADRDNKLKRPEFSHFIKAVRTKYCSGEYPAPETLGARQIAVFTNLACRGCMMNKTDDDSCCSGIDAYWDLASTQKGYAQEMCAATIRLLRDEVDVFSCVGADQPIPSPTQSPGEGGVNGSNGEGGVNGSNIGGGNASESGGDSHGNGSNASSSEGNGNGNTGNSSTGGNSPSGGGNGSSAYHLAVFPLLAPVLYLLVAAIN